MKAYLVLILAILLAVFGVLYIARDFFSEPFEKKYKREQIDALVAMARADTIGVELDKRCAAQKAVVDVALRRQELLEKKHKDATVSFLQMFRTGDTFYPDNWTHSKVFFRSVWAVWGSQRYKGSPWNDVKKCVLDKLKAGIDRKACATKYTRTERRYDGVTDEDAGAKALEASMDIDQTLSPGAGMKFLCPRQK